MTGRNYMMAPVMDAMDLPTLPFLSWRYFLLLLYTACYLILLPNRYTFEVCTIISTVKDLSSKVTV